MKTSTRRAVRRPRPGNPGPMARRCHRAGPVRFVASRAWFVGALVLLLRRSAWEGGVAAQQDDDDGNANDDGSTSAPAALYPDCEADMALVGDALCDLDFNVAECGFDGGDCCECTCVDTGDQVCGEGGGVTSAWTRTPPKTARLRRARRRTRRRRRRLLTRST
ncbi:unnamed protein product [Ectocarpus sp. 4 AP-2014]